MGGFSEAVAIAFTYVGTIVGAGFASGQEIYQFFLRGGTDWPISVSFAAAALFAFGWALFSLSQGHADRSPVQVLGRCLGPKLAQVTDVVINLFLFGGLCIMFAGGGAALQQEWGLHPAWGAAGLALLSWLTVRRGLPGLKIANLLVVPILLAITGWVWLLARPEVAAEPARLWATGAWRSGLLYAAYNSGLALPVLVALGGEARSARRALAGLAMGVLLTTALIAAVVLTLSAAGQEALQRPIPMLHIAGTLHPALHTAYWGTLLGEIYTTAIGSLFGVTLSLSARSRRSFGKTSAGVCLLAWLLSGIGFVNLVAALYPLFGELVVACAALALGRALWQSGRRHVALFWLR